MLFGIVLVVILGLGGFAYRHIVERSAQPVACPLDALVCPDGATVAREGLSCSFPACPPPNVSFPDITVAFAVPSGFAKAELPDGASVAAYESPHAPETAAPASVIIRRYATSASSTALDTIRQTAIGGTSGLPISATRFTSTTVGNRRFTVVSIERFEAVVDTAYYLARGTDVLRFDAIDRDVANWTSPSLDVSTLPAHMALEKLLSTLQGR